MPDQLPALLKLQNMVRKNHGSKNATTDAIVGLTSMLKISRDMMESGDFASLGGLDAETQQVCGEALTSIQEFCVEGHRILNGTAPAPATTGNVLRRVQFSALSVEAKMNHFRTGGRLID